MTKSEGAETRADTPPKASKKDDRLARSAKALRENLKKRKQQLKAREDQKN